MKRKKQDKKMEKPVWLKYTAEEVKGIIVKLGNKGLTSEKIGLTLRDQYGIPKVKLYGIKIKQVLDEKEKYEDPNVHNLKKNLDRIIGHYKKHKGDKKAEHSLIKTRAKLKKREEYLINKAA
jgi:small subunit ribosomal protein S15